MCACLQSSGVVVAAHSARDDPKPRHVSSFCGCEEPERIRAVANQSLHAVAHNTLNVKHVFSAMTYIDNL